MTQPKHITSVTEIVTRKVEGDRFPCFRGLITYVGDYFEGSNDNGPYTLQNIQVCDPENRAQKIGVKLRHQAKLDGRSKNLLFQAVAQPSEKVGWVGIRMKTDGKPGKEKLQVEVNEKGSIVIGKELPSPDSQAPAPDQNQGNSAQSTASSKPTAQEPAKTQAAASTPQNGAGAAMVHPGEQGTPQARQFVDCNTQTPAKVDPKIKAAKDLAHTRQAANRIANTWLVAFQAGLYARKQAKEQLDCDMTPELFQAMVSTIAIQLERDNHHIDMPTGVIELKPKAKAVAAAPAPAPANQTAGLSNAEKSGMI